MTVFTTSLEERKRLLKKLARESKSWKWYMLLFFLLILLSAFTLFSTVFLLIRHPQDPIDALLLSLGAMIFISIPLICAASVRNLAEYRCAAPYSAYVGCVLTLFPDRLEFSYRVANREDAVYEDASDARQSRKALFTYEILREDIVSLEIRRNEICRISGNGTLLAPEWMSEEGGSRENLSEFFFLLSFEQSGSARALEDWAGEKASSAS